MASDELPVVRWADFSLDDQEQAVDDLFARFFAREAPLERVRAVEALGFDPVLWEQLRTTGAVAMGLRDEPAGGLVSAVLAVEHLGRRLAPVPLVEAVVAARVLADADGGRAATEAADGTVVATVALHPADLRPEQLVAAGAVAGLVVALDGDELVVLRRPTPPAHLPNPWGQPVAWWDLHDRGLERVVVGRGGAAVEGFARLRRDWKVLTAAALVGVAHEALAIAVDYAKERTAFGVPIGTFQALSHPMADAAMGTESARRIARKAAWFAEHEPDHADRLAAMALLHASEVATTTAHLAIHVLGGIGFTVEAAPHLYYRKAKGYVLAGGDPQAELQVIAALAYDERPSRALEEVGRGLP